MNESPAAHTSASVRLHHGLCARLNARAQAKNERRVSEHDAESISRQPDVARAERQAEEIEEAIRNSPESTPAAGAMAAIQERLPAIRSQQELQILRK